MLWPSMYEAYEFCNSIYLNKNVPMSDFDVPIELQKKMESILAAPFMNDFRQLVWLTTFRSNEEKYVHKCDKGKMCVMINYLTNSMELSPSREGAQSLSYSRISQHFMDSEGTLLCSQEPSAGPRPESDQSSPLRHNYASIIDAGSMLVI
jgi:hypothetical protein